MTSNDDLVCWLLKTKKNSYIIAYYGPLIFLNVKSIIFNKSNFMIIYYSSL